MRDDKPDFEKVIWDRFLIDDHLTLRIASLKGQCRRRFVSIDAMNRISASPFAER